ncbi:DUF4167 domain-containing protein [Holospora curviuscula]|uniref:DUF4167 domain-containing protein n=1 Tax=Holospora curviuscula TaxID=1082868 RepID=A0A2S5R8Q5_9PROT|nr:DUF4167 domain-containing protein [Holospora curviuscula]PPE03677.1 hypothetical protein HCUR_00907 [Holospora curviuscula]
MNSFRDKQQGSYRLRSGNSGHQGYQKVVKNRHHIFESQGPTGKARGTSVQLVEKYLSLGREAFSIGDTVLSEYFFEYVEHYQRISHDFNTFKPENSGAVSNGAQKKTDLEVEHIGKSNAQNEEDSTLEVAACAQGGEDSTKKIAEDSTKKISRTYRRKPTRSGEIRDKHSPGGVILPVSISENAWDEGIPE